MSLEEKTRSIRLSKKAADILEQAPAKYGISKNRFINECIEAQKTSSSRKIKQYHAKQIIGSTIMSLLVMSEGYNEMTPEYIKAAHKDMIEGSLSNGSFKCKTK